MITDWLAFWDSPHSIYVNARHKDVHYRLIAEQICGARAAPPDARVLDYGCGEALHADIVAAAAGELLLCEAAPGVRAGLAQRFADNPKIHVLAPHEIAPLPEHSLDLIVLHSVVQYLTPTGASALFVLFHRLLKPGGAARRQRRHSARGPGGDRRAGAAALRRRQRLLLCRCRGDSCARCCRTTGGCARARAHPLRAKRR